MAKTASKDLDGSAWKRTIDIALDEANNEVDCHRILPPRQLCAGLRVDGSSPRDWVLWRVGQSVSKILYT